MSLARESAELVIGLVTPVGVDIRAVDAALAGVLGDAGYEQVTYRLSELFASLTGLPPVDTSSEARRLETAMNAGNELRRRTERPEIMAIQAAARIHNERQPDEGPGRRAHVLRSLKRGEEILYLRRLYGPRFVLISVYQDQEKRVSELVRQGVHKAEAQQLVVRDEDEGLGHGQATRDAFHLADLFLEGDARTVRQELARFLDLILGSPMHTPTMDEHGMFLAYASSLRSGDLSRQVGAVVMTSDGTLLAEGCNDAPRFGGGPQWPDERDTRDLQQGYDPNHQIKEQMVGKILEDLHGAEREKVKAAIARSGLLDITEFGRAVHAEMAALMACTRRGTSTVGGVLFGTTFPCHNCAKHIVAAGLGEVVFIEPYPKSRALELHDDAISVRRVDGKLELRPFVGVGPRRYAELFALRNAYGESVKRKDGSAKAAWDRRRATPVVHDRLVTYVELEAGAAIELRRALSDLVDAPTG